MYIFVFVGRSVLQKWTYAWVFALEVDQCLGFSTQMWTIAGGFLSKSVPMPKFFSPEKDQCLGFSVRSGPMRGFFSPEEDQCLGFFSPGVDQCLGFSPWGFLLRIDPKPGLFSPGVDRCLFLVFVFYRSEKIPGFVYP